MPHRKLVYPQYRDWLASSLEELLNGKGPRAWHADDHAFTDWVNSMDDWFPGLSTAGAVGQTLRSRYEAEAAQTFFDELAAIIEDLRAALEVIWRKESWRVPE